MLRFSSTHRLLFGAVVICGSIATVAPQQNGAPLPFELAFSAREFLWREEPAVSPDGAWIAYGVRQAPADLNLDSRFQPSGVPSSVVGGRILMTRLDAENTTPRDICPKGATCWRPSWAPDSRRVAFYADAEGSPQLWVYSLDTREARRVSAARIKPKLWVGDEPVWHPSAQEIFVPLAPDQSGGGDATEAAAASSSRPASGSTGVTVTVFRAGRERQLDQDRPTRPLVNHFLRENNAAMAAINATTGKVRVIAPADALPRPSVLRLSASGRWMSYLSVFKAADVTSQQSTMDLAVVPSSGGAVTMLAVDLPVHQSDYHHLNYRWHPTEDRLVFLRDRKLWLVESTSTGWSDPQLLGASLGPLAPSPLRFTRDGKAVVVGTQPVDDKDYSDSRPTRVARVPLDGGQPLSVALDDRWEFRALLNADDRTAWQPDGRSLTLQVQEKATGETAIVRAEPGQQFQTLWKGLARIQHLAAGGHHAFIVGRFENVGTPSDLYRFDDDFSSKTRVTQIEPRLAGTAGGTVEIFETTVPLYDGGLERVRTAVLLPPGAKRGDRLPAIVLMYPGSDASRGADLFGGGDRITVPTLVFTSRGYAVIYPHLKLGPNREAGNPAQEMTDVLLPQVYQAAALGYIDLERVGLAGQSFGGYGTAAVLSETNVFRAAVAISGIYDLPGIYGQFGAGGTSFWIGWSEGGQARMGTHPWANLRRYLDNSPYYQADRIRTPLLLVHGDEDEAFVDAEKLFSALRRLDRTVQLAVYHGQGHVISSWTRPNAMDAAARMVDFFGEYLKGTAASASSGSRSGALDRKGMARE